MTQTFKYLVNHYHECRRRGCYHRPYLRGFCPKHYREWSFDQTCDAVGYPVPAGLGYDDQISSVYAVSTDTEPMLVKIGFSSNPPARLKALQTTSPAKLTLMGSITGSLKIEQIIHSILQDYRSHNEWFFYKGKVVEVVDIICSGDLDRLDAFFD